jgi:predicted alpha/beta hydrolase family esterase
VPVPPVKVSTTSDDKSSGKELLINYDSRNGFEKNLENMKELLSAQKDMFFVCHSLGGIYALHLHKNSQIRY